MRDIINKIQKRYKELFEHSLDIIILQDLEGKILYVNFMTLNLISYLEDEIIDRNFIDYLDNADHSIFLKINEEIKVQGNPTDYIPFNIKDKYGEKHKLNFQVIPIKRQNVIIAILWIAHNDFKNDRNLHNSIKNKDILTKAGYLESNFKITDGNKEELIKILNKSPAVFFSWKNEKGWPVEHVSINVNQFGYESEDFLANRIVFENIIHPDDLERVKMEIIQNNKKNLCEFSLQFRIISKDGKIHWVDDRTSIRRDEEGDIMYYQGIILDITDRVETHQLLKESEEKFRSIAEQSIMGIFIAQDETFKYVNHKLSEITGYSMKEMLLWKEMELYKLIHPDYVELLMDQGAKKQRGDKDVINNYQFKGIKKNGDFFWVEMFSHTIYYNGKTADLGILIDITQKKQTEEKLEESELTFLSLAENMQDGLTIIKNNEIIFLNDRIVEITGYSKEELKNMTEFDLAIPEDKKKILNMYKEVRKSNKELKQIKFCILTKGGAHRYITNRYTLLKKNGNMRYLFVLTTDNTEEKISEKLLKESEEKYRDLFENSPFSIILYDLDGNIVDVNNSLTNLFQYSKNELIGKNFSELSTYNIELLPEIKRRFQLLLRSDTLGPIEFEVITKKEMKLIIQSQISKVKLGNTYYLQGFIQDITEKKEAERKLKESEEMFRNIAEQSIMGITIIQDDIIKYANTKVMNIFGYTIEEIKKWGPLEYLKIFLEENREFIRNQERDHPFGYDYSIHDYIIRIKKKNNEIRWVQMYSKGIDYQGHPAAMVIIVDITDKKNAEELLRQSELNFKRMAENIQDGLTINENNEIVFLNDRICEITGYSKNELKSLRGIDLALPQEKEKLKIIQKNNSRYGKQVNELEFWIETKNGEHRCISNRYTRLTRDDGTRLTFILSTDITERKNAEKKLKESEKNYRRAYERETFYKDLFAHDMNNILQGILTSLELSLMTVPNIIDFSELKENLTEIRYQVDRATSLVQNVTKFSEIDESQTQLKLISVKKTLNKAIITIKKGTIGKEIDIEINSVSEDIFVLADDFLIDVFENILINSVKHNLNPKVQIIINISKTQDFESKSTLIEFIDNGKGIPDVKKNNLFERGFKEDKSVSGMGFGLSLVKKIIDNYKAEIRVENRIPEDYSKGSKIIITFSEVS